MKLQEQVGLARYTTFHIGGPARWFATAETEADVVDAHRFATERHLPLFVLGGGSNVLVADAGYPGVVLHMGLAGIEAGPDGLLQVGAGESWDGLVNLSVDRDLAGMECLAGIPGTVGGTPIQNVGAYGQDVSETIRTVRAWDTQNLRFVELSNNDCGFAYRTSLLNTEARGRFIVTRVDFTLTHAGQPCLRYAELQRRFADRPSPTLAEVADAVRSIRRSKSMVIDPADPNSRSAGSFFRNPIVPSAGLATVAAESGLPIGDVPHWTVDEDRIKLPAAWLLEHAGFVRGYALGNAGISTRHTLALINRAGATASDIGALRDLIVAGVRSRFGIALEQEPVNVG